MYQHQSILKPYINIESNSEIFSWPAALLYLQQDPSYILHINICVQKYLGKLPNKY
jgi:hypothetical protein